MATEEENVGEESTDTVDDSTVQEPNFLDMSAEEFEKASLQEVSEEGLEEALATANADDNDDDDNEDPDTDSSDDSSDDQDVDGDDSDDEDSVDDMEDISDDEDDSDGETDDTDKADDANDDDSETNAKDQLAKLFAPFRANNRDMQVDNVDDALTLMKMGANYNKKMAALKPNLKLVKMLQNNNLLDESKLTYLIDLDKKNPEAIKKFIKESGINPMDVDMQADASYEPDEQTYKVHDTEVELDGILDEIKDTESFKDTIDIVSNKLDDASKQIIASNPEIVRILNGHMQAGIYNRITAVVEQQRALGKLAGLNDLEAYKQVGDVINAQGGFNKPADSNTADSTEAKDTVTKKKVTDSKRKSKKKAASTTKSSTRQSGDTDFNPLSMSDEDFEKVSGSKFL